MNFNSRFWLLNFQNNWFYHSDLETPETIVCYVYSANISENVFWYMQKIWLSKKTQIFTVACASYFIYIVWGAQLFIFLCNNTVMISKSLKHVYDF